MNFGTQKVIRKNIFCPLPFNIHPLIGLHMGKKTKCDMATLNINVADSDVSLDKKTVDNDVKIL